MRLRTITAGIVLVIGALLLPSRIQAGLRADDCIGAHLSNGIVFCGDPGTPPAKGIGLLHEAAGSPVTVPGNLRDLKLVDVNGDGALDAILLTTTSVEVMLGNGQGGFGASIVSPTTAFALRIAIGDVNGDGRPDVVVQGQPFFGFGEVLAEVLLGAGDGTFAPVSSITTSDPMQPRGIAIADVTGDSIPDVVMMLTRTGSTSAAAVWSGDGSGAFMPHGQTLAPPFFTPPPVQTIVTTAFSLADVNGDGALDVLTNSDGAAVWYGNGDGSFALPVTVGAPSAFLKGIGSSIAGADVNGDGLDDVVHYDALQFRVTLNGPGGFGPGTSIYQAVPDPSETFSTSMALADMDGDGALDAIGMVAGANIGEGSEDVGPHVSVLFGDGAGGFSNPSFYPTVSGVASVPLIAVGDLNGDGRPDVIAPSANGAMTVLLSGSQSVSFARFQAALEIDRKKFDLDGVFRLRKASDGINPATEDVTLAFGSVSQTIPAGSFKFHRARRNRPGRWEDAFDRWTFTGKIGGSPVEVCIVRLGHRWFTISWAGRGMNLPAPRVRIPVELTIGDDTGTDVVKPRR